jgi:hypothetical protein
MINKSIIDAPGDIGEMLHFKTRNHIVIKKSLVNTACHERFRSGFED